MKARNLAQGRRGKTIADGVTLTWPAASGEEPVTLHISGAEMKKPVVLRTSQEGVSIERVSGKHDYVSYQLKATNAKDMGYRTIWMMEWLEEKGYEHIKWINQGPRESVGYARKIRMPKMER